MDDPLPSFKVAHVSRFLGSNLPSGYLITQKEKQLEKTDTVFTPNRHKGVCASSFKKSYFFGKRYIHG